MPNNHLRLADPSLPTLLDALLGQVRDIYHSSVLADERGGQGPDAYLTSTRWGMILEALERINPRAAIDTIRRLEKELGVRGTAGVFREALRLAREAQATVGGLPEAPQPRSSAHEPQPLHTEILRAAYLDWISDASGRLRFAVEPFDAFHAGYLAALDSPAETVAVGRAPPSEPTEAMVAAGESAASIYIGKPTDDDGIPLVWRRMFEAWHAEFPDSRVERPWPDLQAAHEAGARQSEDLVNHYRIRAERAEQHVRLLRATLNLPTAETETPHD